MTEHLPECHYIEDTSGVRYGWNDCICDELRACEQRVAEETEAAMMKFFYWKPSPPHDKHYFADNVCAYCVGRREALDAAVQRVEALNFWEEHVREFVHRDEAIAAIKGEQE